MKIFPDDKRLVYSGRIDWSDPKRPIWIYPATFVKLRFTGESLSVRVSNKNLCWNNYIGFIADGEQSKQLINKDGETHLSLELRPVSGGVHNVLMFKRQDACHELTILDFELADGGELLDAEPLPKGCMEVYGDSVSAGEVSEAVEYAGKADPEHNGEYSNSWYSYAWMTARNLGVQLHDVAQGGISLYDGIGWFHAPNYIGMESAWNKLSYNPDFGEPTPWDFTAYTPQLVIVAIGQNDANPDDFMKNAPEGEKAVYWREHYRAFIENIREKYPEAYIVCCTTLIEHDANWDKSIDSVVKSLGDEKVFYFMYKRNGSATPGHPRIPEAQEMADELTAFIKSLNIEAWDK